MKTIFSLRRHGYLKTVSIFLIAVILIAGVVGCEGEAETYDLTMAVNPADGGTATDETGTSPYERATVVDIKAVPDPCYRFVSWTAQAGTFGNSTAPETTFTMPAQDITVTANFEPVPPDHFKLYFVEEGSAPAIGEEVQLEDQFGTFNVTVGEAKLFGNPVKKVHGTTTEPISDWDRHYTMYFLEHEEGWMPSYFQVTVSNQFDQDKELTVYGPVLLAVPTAKEDQEMSDCLDHLLIYFVMYPAEYIPEPIGEIDLYDQFHDELGVTVYEPTLFANPVKKTRGSEVTPITTDEHYVFYPIDGEPFQVSDLPITNQFGNQALDLADAKFLAVPSEKKDWEQPVNHFKTYWADWAYEPPPLWEPPLPVDVELEDQFVTINATVVSPFLFANPVKKTVLDEVTPIWDPKDHLTLYNIDSWSAPQEWNVWVRNQFGSSQQQLRVAGPFWLAVPTGKLTPDWPADVNHYLVYVVYPKQYTPVDVSLKDQFIDGETTVYEPYLFAVPAQKTYDGVVTPIMDDVHLVFYWIDGLYFWDADSLPVANQFGEQYLYVEEWEENFLGVPSQKVGWEGPYPYEPP